MLQSKTARKNSDPEDEGILSYTLEDFPEERDITDAPEVRYLCVWVTPLCEEATVLLRLQGKVSFIASN
jgi:hypothetical protein